VGVALGRLPVNILRLLESEHGEAERTPGGAFLILPVCVLSDGQTHIYVRFLLDVVLLFLRPCSAI
jgi:hypothetical protein